MPLAKRIIPCLDVKEGKVVKGINFLNLKNTGDPVELAKRYSDEGADELVFLDINASADNRKIINEVVKDVAKNINIPFTVGGGIRSSEDARLILCNGADKVSINTAAVTNPKLIEELANIFGKQCVVVAIDVKRHYEKKEGKIMVETAAGTCWFEVYTYGGRKPTGLDAIKWAIKALELGAGEFLVTSMDCDGTEEGYDIELTKTIAKSVSVPVIASGGAGKPEHFLKIFTEGTADAALAASVFHYKKYPIAVIKKFLAQKGVAIR